MARPSGQASAHEVALGATGSDSPGPGGRRVESALIAALLAGSTWEQAATAAGCSRATVSRRLAEPAFRARLEEARAEHLQLVSDRLAHACTSAVETLEGIMADPAAPPSARVSAARSTLDLAGRYREMVEVEERLQALEALALRDERPDGARS